ncbi:DUF3717 domain-containing protein [Massilia sp. W12]|uniref:DUF3717 domain-containing protein n=1 Tax=Massilia sp. W12 TaxID=3126507 RepID=UPI0030D3CBD8
MKITLFELEDAINFWRAQHPASGEEKALSPEVNALATLYALMIYHHQREVSVEAKLLPILQIWREQVIKP